jgi:hypothetical protein
LQKLQEAGFSRGTSCHYCRQKKTTFVECNRSKFHRWCSSCVKNGFGLDFDKLVSDKDKNWPKGCPICTKSCHCSLCRKRSLGQAGQTDARCLKQAGAKHAPNKKPKKQAKPAPLNRLGLPRAGSPCEPLAFNQQDAFSPMSRSLAKGMDGFSLLTLLVDACDQVENSSGASLHSPKDRKPDMVTPRSPAKLFPAPPASGHQQVAFRKADQIPPPPPPPPRAASAGSFIRPPPQHHVPPMRGMTPAERQAADAGPPPPPPLDLLRQEHLRHKYPQVRIGSASSLVSPKSNPTPGPPRDFNMTSICLSAGTPKFTAPGTLNLKLNMLAGKTSPLASPPLTPDISPDADAGRHVPDPLNLPPSPSWRRNFHQLGVPLSPGRHVPCDV